MAGIQRAAAPTSVGISSRARSWDVESFTSIGTTYLVTQNASPGRPWMCECPAWKFAKRGGSGRKPDCKHIIAVQSASQSVHNNSIRQSVVVTVATKKGAEQMNVRRRPEAKLV